MQPGQLTQDDQRDILYHVMCSAIKAGGKKGGERGRTFGVMPFIFPRNLCNGPVF